MGVFGGEARHEVVLLAQLRGIVLELFLLELVLVLGLRQRLVLCCVLCLQTADLIVAGCDLVVQLLVGVERLAELLLKHGRLRLRGVQLQLGLDNGAVRVHLGLGELVLDCSDLLLLVLDDLIGLVVHKVLPELEMLDDGICLAERSSAYAVGSGKVHCNDGVEPEVSACAYLVARGNFVVYYKVNRVRNSA